MDRPPGKACRRLANASHAKLPLVKSLRVWILLLLVALLPFRGSLAATLMCHEGASASHADAIEHLHEHAAISGVMDKHHDQSGTADKCSVCSGLTSPACPLDAALPVVVAPAHSQLVPQPTVWPPSFVAAGLKRPPRST
jgi:hypothetical protein